MIALTNAEGKALRVLSPVDGETFGYHRSHGFISTATAEGRKVVKKRVGLAQAEKPRDWLCQFRLTGGEWRGVSGCVAEKARDGRWQLKTDLGDFFLVDASTLAPVALTPEEKAKGDDSRLPGALALLVFVAMFGSAIFTLDRAQTDDVDMKELTENQKTIVIPKVKVTPPPKVVEPKAPEKKVAAKIVQKKPKTNGAAVKNKLGFLSLLGKKELKNAMGGMPTPAERKSPGAGAGGDQGSGGELLSGLGKGVKQTTVGNTGVAGLGGIGNAGAGGGAGGFGTSYVGSGGEGGGRVLSDVALSEDVVLEGGLDRAVIQATIAKYLSQVRACYERGLRKSPGLTGQVLMDFEIEGGGKLNFAKVKKTSLGNDEVETCISKVMMTWRFPKPVGGTLVRVSYPFMLKPANYM